MTAATPEPERLARKLFWLTALYAGAFAVAVYIIMFR
jgi:hypothetical protein